VREPNREMRNLRTRTKCSRSYAGDTSGGNTYLVGLIEILKLHAYYSTSVLCSFHRVMFFPWAMLSLFLLFHHHVSTPTVSFWETRAKCTLLVNQPGSLTPNRSVTYIVYDVGAIGEEKLAKSLLRMNQKTLYSTPLDSFILAILLHILLLAQVYGLFSSQRRHTQPVVSIL